LAGGTGITPCYQLVRHVLAHEDDYTMISVLYANVSEQDILLFKEMNELKKKYRQKLRLCYTLSDISSVGEDWKYGVGKFTEEMLRENLFDAQVTYQTSQLVCVCGPPRFMESICGDAVMIEGNLHICLGISFNAIPKITIERGALCDASTNLKIVSRTLM
jgi:NAD(P)H-flavin reductase